MAVRYKDWCFEDDNEPDCYVDKKEECDVDIFTGEETAHPVRIRMGKKLYCYDLASLHAWVTRNGTDPILRTPLSAAQKARINTLYNRTFGGGAAMAAEAPESPRRAPARSPPLHPRAAAAAGRDEVQEVYRFAWREEVAARPRSIRQRVSDVLRDMIHNGRMNADEIYSILERVNDVYPREPQHRIDTLLYATELIPLLRGARDPSRMIRESMYSYLLVASALPNGDFPVDELDYILDTPHGTMLKRRAEEALARRGGR